MSYCNTLREEPRLLPARIPFNWEDLEGGNTLDEENRLLLDAKKLITKDTQNNE